MKYTLSKVKQYPSTRRSGVRLSQGRCAVHAPALSVLLPGTLLPIPRGSHFILGFLENAGSHTCGFCPSQGVLLQDILGL